MSYEKSKEIINGIKKEYDDLYSDLLIDAVNNNRVEINSVDDIFYPKATAYQVKTYDNKDNTLINDSGIILFKDV